MRIKNYLNSNGISQGAHVETAKFQYSAGGRKLLVDHVIKEQPLQIKLLWHVAEKSVYSSRIFSITMRTPGDDKALIIGLLISEGVIQSTDQISSIQPDIDDEIESEQSKKFYNQWKVELAEGLIPEINSLDRFQVTYSSCGLCGTTSLKSLELKNPPQLNVKKHWLAFEYVCAMPDVMRKVQKSFTQTGGSHAAALFNHNAELIDIKEDIGRHNALDKLFGANCRQHYLDDLPYCAVVSGRISFEIVQKSVMAGIPVLIAVGAPSELAILAAKRFDLTLIGFTHSAGFNLYHGDWRLAPLEE